MEQLLEKSAALVQRIRTEKRRYLYYEINWNNRLIGIKGARGTGKTTLMLQKLKQLALAPMEGTYWSLDDFYFTTHSLVETAEEFYKKGGKYLFLDEVHKYENWSLHIKNLYDFYPELKIVFTGSSIIDISREEGDLSRRVLMYSLFGLSFREYLDFNDLYSFVPISLNDILSSDRNWRNMFPQDFRPLAHFQDYLEHGYYPFSMEDREGYATRLQQLVRLTVEYRYGRIKRLRYTQCQKNVAIAQRGRFQCTLSAQY